MVNPSITPLYGNNPGVSVVEIGDDQIARNLRQSYLNLNATIGKDDVTPYDELDFRNLDMAADYGLADLSGASIAKLQESLKADTDL